MARYTGPKTKIARKFGEPIFGDDKSFEKIFEIEDKKVPKFINHDNNYYLVELIESKNIHKFFNDTHECMLIIMLSDLPCFNLLSSIIKSISFDIPKKLSAVVALAGAP